MNLILGNILEKTLHEQIGVILMQSVALLQFSPSNFSWLSQIDIQFFVGVFNFDVVHLLQCLLSKVLCFKKNESVLLVELVVGSNFHLHDLAKLSSKCLKSEFPTLLT